LQQNNQHFNQLLVVMEQELLAQQTLVKHLQRQILIPQALLQRSNKSTYLRLLKHQHSAVQQVPLLAA
jgi:hypothetical protein